MIVKIMKLKSKEISTIRQHSLNKQMMAFLGVLTTLTFAVSCNNSNSPASTKQAQELKNDGFIEGVWVDRWLLDKVKQGDFDAAWKSLRNFTSFGTRRNANGKPSWIATVPDDSGELTLQDGKWYDGSTELLAFQFQEGDTLAQYRFNALGYEEEGVGPFRTYQLIPRMRTEDTFISDDWIYQLYYFPGSYMVDSLHGDMFQVGFTNEGKVLGMEGFVGYGLNIGNSLPLFSLESTSGTFATYVIKGTKSGFDLFRMENEELDGYDNDIIQGAQAFKFIRKEFLETFSH
jgi:hypothetical protein